MKSLKNLTDNELIERLGTVVNEISTIKRAALRARNDNADDEIFEKAALFFKEEAENIMKELMKRK